MKQFFGMERRRNKRTELKSKIMVKRLDSKIPDEVMIDIVDVSKTGIGFVCEEALNIGSIYESFLTIWTKEVIHAFIQVVRIELIEGDFHYGAIFIGMPEMDAARIETYQIVNDK